MWIQGNVELQNKSHTLVWSLNCHSQMIQGIVINAVINCIPAPPLPVQNQGYNGDLPRDLQKIVSL